jgi:hypothetical protein
MKSLKKLAGGMVPTLLLTIFTSPGLAGYADDVLGLGPSLYYRLDETDIKPSSPESGLVVRNLATGGLLFNAAYATQSAALPAASCPAWLTARLVPSWGRRQHPGFSLPKWPR